MLTTDRLAARRFELMAAEYLQRMGARIKARREEVGLSQSALARELPGTTDGNQVSRWERGLHRPSDDTLEQIARILDVDVTYFLAAPADKSNGTPDPFAEREPDELVARLASIEAKLDQLLGAVSPAQGEGVPIPEDLPPDLREGLGQPPATAPPAADIQGKRGSSGQGA